MGGLRASSIVVSMVLHGGLLMTLADWSGGRSLEAGTGSDLLRIEQGIALEGLTRLGKAAETVEAREVTETEASKVQPELQEIKAAQVQPDEPPEVVPPAENPPEIKDVLSSPLGPTQEIEMGKPPLELKKPQPKQLATEQQLEQVAALEQKAASRGQDGGDATAYRAFLGALSRHIEKFKLPHEARRGQQLESGRVVMLIELDRKGGLVAARVHRSSGSEQLDKLAMESVERGQPYPVEEKYFEDATFKLEIPFIYKVRE